MCGTTDKKQINVGECFFNSKNFEPAQVCEQEIG